MKSNIKYLKSFTIIEMMITLVLSAIIVSASIMIYLNYEKLIKMKTKNINNGKTIMQFFQILKFEYDNSELIQCSGNKITFLRSLNQPIQYEIGKNYITRKNASNIDTFNLIIDNYKFLKDELTGMPKIFKLDLNNEGESFSIIMIKQYSNETMMNLNLNK